MQMQAFIAFLSAYGNVNYKAIFIKIKRDAYIGTADITLNVQNPFINCILYILLKESIVIK